MKKSKPGCLSIFLGTVLVLVALFIFMLIIAATSDSNDNKELTSTTASIEETTIKADSKYLTKGEWALIDTNYMFAIENDSYDGDVFEAGTYTFTLAAGVTKSADKNNGIAKAPAMFDVYVADEEYSNLSNLLTSNEPTFSVGGMGSIDYECELKEGKYVYVIPFKDVLYEPSGYLSFYLTE